MEDLRIGFIDFASDAYEDTVVLRHKILREPLGLAFTEEQLSREEGDYHLAVYQDNELLACLILVDSGEGRMKMRQVAVAESSQRKGLGQIMCNFAEDFAREQKMNTIYCHARDVAVAFYEKLSYNKIGEPFEEVGITHYRMEKAL